MSDIRQLMDMGDSYIENEDYSAALRLYERALKIAMDRRDIDNSAHAHLKIGKIMLVKEKLELAKENFHISEVLFSEAGIDLRYLEAIYYLGRTYFYLHEYKKASKYLKKSLKELGQDQEPPWKVELHYFLGITSIELFSLDVAYENLLKAQKLYQKKAYRRGVADTFFHFGELYWRAEDHRMAHEYFDRAIIIYSEIRSGKDIAETCYMLGKINQEEDNYGAAARFFQSAFNKFNDGGYKLRAADSAIKLGKIHFEENERQEAERLFDKARELYRESGKNKKIAKTYSYQANIYIKAGDTTSARRYFAEALHNFMEANAVENSIECLEKLGKLCLEAGNLKEARHYFLEAIDFNVLSGSPADLSEIRKSIDEIHQKLRNSKKGTLKKKENS